MEPLHIEMANVRLRLHATKAFSPELAHLLDEIDEMGEYSRQLIPDLIETMKRGVYVPTTPLVRIISRLKSAELLDAAMEQSEGEWPLSTFDRCELLQAGFGQFQQGLIDELFQVFESDVEPRRSAIVNALEKSGTPAALEVLRVIEYRTAESIAKLVAELRGGDLAQEAAKQLMCGDHVPGRKAFLGKVRRAIQEIENRPAPAHPTEASEVLDQGADELEMAHVLFVDLVGYSKLPMKTQLEFQKRLTQVVESLGSVRRNSENNRLIIRPTGDGMALAFFGGVKPHVDAATELHHALANEAQIKLRTGLHSGPVHRVVDINGQPDISGNGINIAQRVMDVGDPGHILLSNAVAETLLQLGGWDDLLQDLGLVEVKHGVQLHIFNLCGEGFGKNDRPSKLKAESLIAAISTPAVKTEPNERTSSRANIRSAISAELDTNLELLRSIWNPVLEASRTFQHADHINRMHKGDAIRRIVLPVWRLEKWNALLPHAVEALTSEEFDTVDRFYSRLAKLSDLRRGDIEQWRVGGELIISDLIADGNPLRKN